MLSDPYRGGDFLGGHSEQVALRTPARPAERMTRGKREIHLQDNRSSMKSFTCHISGLDRKEGGNYHYRSFFFKKTNKQILTKKADCHQINVV